MKMKKEHYEHIKSEIEGSVALDKETIERYETGDFVNSGTVKNLQRRYIWDSFYSAGLTKFACSTLYKYIDDSHIETALKKILPTVTRRY